MAVIEILEKTLHEKEKKLEKTANVSKKESERALIEQIYIQFATPMSNRTNFIRKRLFEGDSCL